MKMKLIMATGLIAVAAAAVNAECTSSVTGFYGAVKIGYGVTTVKDEVKYKAAELKGKKSYKTPGVVDETTKKAQSDLAAAKDAVAEMLRLLLDKEAPTKSALFGADGVFGFTEGITDFDTVKVEINKKIATWIDGINEKIKPSGYQLEKFELTTDSSDHTQVQWADLKAKNTADNSEITLIKAGVPGAPTNVAADLGAFAENFANHVNGAEFKKITDKIVVDLSEIKVGDPVTTTSKEETTYAIKELNETVLSNKNNATIGVQVGYQFASGAFYVGAEIGAEFTPGKVNVIEKDADTLKSNKHVIGDNVITYKEAVTAGRPEITYKTKYSFGFTPIIGVTAGNWIFYVPVTLKVSSHELEVIPNANKSATIQSISYDEATANAFDMNLVEHALTGKDASTGDLKKSKTKFGVEFGLGAKVMLTQNVFVGLRYMYSPKQSVELDIKGYDSNLYHDRYRNGTQHKVSVESHKGFLEIGYKF